MPSFNRDMEGGAAESEAEKGHLRESSFLPATPVLEEPSLNMRSTSGLNKDMVNVWFGHRH